MTESWPPLNRSPGRHALTGGAHDDNGGRAERVLFAAPAGDRPTAALCRAAALARLAGAELHVLRVVPGLTRTDALFPRLHILEAMRAVAEALAEVRRTQAWCDGALTEQLLDERLHVRTGGFADEVTSCADELGAGLVVIPPLGDLRGSAVAALSRAAGVPLLVARPPAARATIMAATDLEDERYPVLCGAGALGRRLDAAVVALHNVTPRVCFAASRSLVALPGGRELAERRRRLADAADDCGVDSEAVVASEVDPTEAILGQARVCGADIIVVGTRPRSWLRGLSIEGVAAQVVDRADRSVLVTPIGVSACQPATSSH